jgi:glucose/arabinose dehydrogenase
MTYCATLRRSLLLAVATGTLGFATLPSLAQQSAAPAAAPAAKTEPPPAPGTPLYGRPDYEGAKKLAPVPPPPLPAAADALPTGKLTVPKGFNIEVYASGMAGARSLRVSDKGTLFVGTWQIGKVYAVPAGNGKHEVKTLYSGLDWPNGIVIHNGTLYVAEHDKVSKAENIEANLDSPPKLTPIYTDLPPERPHGWKFMALGPDNKLYVPVGQPCNNCLVSPKHGQIRRINLDGSGAEVIARGVRNTVGFDWHPVTKQLYFTDNGRDWLGEDIPNDELNRLTKVGEHFGSPFCYQGNVLDSDYGWGHSCSDYTPPVALMGPHAASLGMRFYTGKMFPAKYHDAIFVARHGSWNRSKKFGGDVVAVHLNKDGTVRSIEPFLTGFLVDNSYIGRPVDVQPLHDGSLLVSDDWNGAVYRISYGKARTANR